MRDRVDGPHVVADALDRGEAVRLGGCVVAGLLETEREHAVHEPRVRDAAGSMRRAGSGDAVAQVGGVAEEEVELVAGEQGQQVGGPLDQELVERPGGAVPVAGDPPLDRGLVGGLPRSQRRAERSSDAEARAPGRSGTSVELSDR